MGLFGIPSVQAKLPLYWYLSPKEQEAFNNNWPALVQWFGDTVDKFAVAYPNGPKPIVYRLPDAPHYFFINDQAFVVREMREFLLGTVGH